MDKPDRIYLVGYRGTGKSTVGQLLAQRLQYQFLDADSHIEKVTGRTIADLFAEEGEEGFRERESQILQQLSQLPQAVIGTGGGVVLRPSNRELIQRTGYVIWLQASPQVIWDRLCLDPLTTQRRPHLTTQGGYHEILHLVRVREPLYREVSDLSLSTDGLSPDQVVDTILKECRLS